MPCACISVTLVSLWCREYKMGSWAYFDPEYETLSIRMNPPQFSFRPLLFLLWRLCLLAVEMVISCASLLRAIKLPFFSCYASFFNIQKRSSWFDHSIMLDFLFVFSFFLLPHVASFRVSVDNSSCKDCTLVKVTI